MTIVSTLDVKELTREEYRAVLDQMAVEAQPARGIYLHIATEIDTGIRVLEIWDERAGFEHFVEHRLVPATRSVGVNRQTDVTVEPLHLFFAPRLSQLPAVTGAAQPKVVTTLDVTGLTAREFRAILDRMDVEANPEAGLYLHMTAPTPTGFRIVELWDSRAGFESFAENRLAPATQALGIQRPTAIHFGPLINCFAPRLGELPSIVGALPGAPRQKGMGRS